MCPPPAVALITSSTDSPVSFDTDGTPFVIDKFHKSAERRCNALYKLGACVLFKSSNGQPERVVYEGASTDGLHTFIRYKDGRHTLTTSPHLCLTNQADPTNLPKLPQYYCQDVGKGLEISGSATSMPERPHLS